MRIARLTALVAVVMLTVPLVGLAAAGRGQTAIDGGNGVAGEFVPGEVLVGFRPDAEPAGIGEALRALGAHSTQKFPAISAERVQLPPWLAVEDAIRVLSAIPGVRYAEPNYVVHATLIPTDPRRNDLWGLHNVGQTGGTADADVDALEAWGAETGTGAVVVGVIDTGIDYNHEDLVGNLWTNTGEDLNLNGVVDPSDFNGVDDDGNGYVDDLRGWDCINDDNDPIDDNNHGTHVSGTIGARANNGIGVVGLNWNVKLMPLKFLSAGGFGSNADAIECVNYAASFKDGSGNSIVRITSNSWGGGQRSNALQDAIANSGSLFVAAAGNSGSSQKMYPAAYSLDNIISVAATDANDGRASFSNYGSDWVDLGAPGVGIVSSVRNNKYASFSGTSMATPHVSGVAALVMAHLPSMTNAEVKAAIMGTVDSVPALAGKTVTGGRLNAAKALGVTPDAPDPTPPAAIADLAADPATTDTTVTLSWTATGDDGADGTAYAYDVRYLKGTPVTEANWATASKAMGEGNPQPSGSPETVTVTGLLTGTTYHFALRAIDDAGNPSPLSNGASATTTGPAWDVWTVDGTGDMGRYKSLAYDPLGNPAIAYTAGAGYNQLRFAHWNGASWDTEVVGCCRIGASLAYGPDGRPSISAYSGGIKFYIKDGGTWTTEWVERSNQASGEFSSLAYGPAGIPTIAYRRLSPNGQGDLMFAQRIGGTWSSQVAHAGATVTYTSLVYDPAGNPAIAYSDDANKDGSPDTVRLARWNGASWDTQVVETGVYGYGAYVSLAFDPTTGEPAILHGNSVPSRFLRWTGAAWSLELVTAGVRGTLAFDSAGVAYVGLTGGGKILLTERDPATATWTTTAVDAVSDSLFVSTKLDIAGMPSVAYYDSANQDLKFARMRP